MPCLLDIRLVCAYKIESILTFIFLFLRLFVIACRSADAFISSFFSRYLFVVGEAFLDGCAYLSFCDYFLSDNELIVSLWHA